MTIDDLIAACTVTECNGIMYASTAENIRRILEAVREDMVGDEASCINRQLAQLCANHTPRVGICQDCPHQHHAATRAALEIDNDD